MALGAIQALKAAGMNPGKDVKVVSVDGQKSALEAIIAGDLNITVESTRVSVRLPLILTKNSCAANSFRRKSFWKISFTTRTCGAVCERSILNQW
jgi:hypothetical protein